jgi:OOP family OmpA-OmpF porin
MPIKLIGTIAGLLLLAGCTSNIQQIKAAEGTGSPYSKALTTEYKAFVVQLTDAYDWSHADYFAKKGLSAAHGDVVLPEDVAKWNVMDSSKDSLNTARQSLIAALDGGARDAKPDLAAKAQVRFDCWVLDAFEGNLPHVSSYTYEDSSYDTSAANPYAVFACKAAFQSDLAAIQK